MIYAHDWNILNGERIPRWPSKIGDLRSLVVTITSWIGVSIGAKHVSVRVEEEKNQWWSEEQNDWVILSCDHGNRGYELRAEVYSNEEAKKVAKYFIKIINKNNDHRIVWM
ncbi:MAG: hypothetical protein WC449_06110 [Candidatus Paceibacterota bacterium]